MGDVDLELLHLILTLGDSLLEIYQKHNKIVKN
jgi:hypothetical protein